ncbi:hypothetical protein [Aromatoleum evansii]|uniref:hypothetical protein n=1 Tax=Aromatoleum evansii TaxID=59406 RepID=UPI00145FC65C|nr:hypothetical protein [Aromatoleum evansii]NMG32347.1 hypothetical protein [Aromatoleum evansii]
MMTKEFLQAVKAKHELKCDAELARLLESSTPVISRYMTGQRVMDDYTAAKVAELLDLDPMIVIAQANAEREKDEKKRAFWSKFAAAASLAMVVGFFSTVAPKNAYASTAYSGLDSTSYQLWLFSIRRWNAGRRP